MEPQDAVLTLEHVFPGEGWTAWRSGAATLEVRCDNPARTPKEIAKALARGEEATAGRAWKAVRAERDRRLAACDWTQLVDVPEGTRSAWRAYRQLLRDLPSRAVDPSKVSWPAPPA